MIRPEIDKALFAYVVTHEPCEPKDACDYIRDKFEDATYDDYRESYWRLVAARSIELTNKRKLAVRYPPQDYEEWSCMTF